MQKFQKKFDDTNRGVLFRNDRKDGESSPDYTGQINVAGDEHRLSAWLKTSKKGVKFLSLSVRPKEDGPAGKDNAADVTWVP